MENSDNDNAPQNGPLDARAFLKRGMAHLDAGRLDEAITDLTEVVRREPAEAMAYLYRGIALISKDDGDAALRDLDEALRLYPDYGLALHWRGHLHHTQGRPDDALADLARAVELEPNDAAIHSYRGRVHFDVDDFGAAVDDLTTAIRLSPDDANAHVLRGQAYEFQDAVDEALADYAAAIRLAPDDGDGFYFRGRLHRHEGNPESAIADLTAALQLKAFPAHALSERGAAWCDLERLDDALADLTEAIRLRPDLVEPRRRRGWVFEWLDKFEQADLDHDEADRLEAREKPTMPADKILVLSLLQKHFEPTPLDQLTITERRFPARVHADLQRALDRLGEAFRVLHFCGVRKQYDHHGVNFTDLLIRDRNDPPCVAPPQYEEIDVGEEQPIRALRSGLWLLEEDGVRLAVFQEPHRGGEGVRFQVATVNAEPGIRSTTRFFNLLEAAVREARSYRGKILSLEYVQNYSGRSTGIKVHKLRRVEREQVILPRRTLDLLDRNVLEFVRRRPKLAELGLATKKGLLFYGPPGTGKTHTLHYLAAALPETTTLLISAEQVGALAEYMTLARLLQPSLVVIEDADLIARNRQQMSGPCEEVLLNKLLNEMDGLKPEADILFVLTTNRPEAIEAALSSRPGRIDQAIEFPHPDAEGRAKLVRLYAGTNRVPEAVVEAVVKKTDKVSAAFIKELMRRAAQFQLEREAAEPSPADVDDALEELLFAGGSLNRKLLGGEYDAANDDE